MPLSVILFAAWTLSPEGLVRNEGMGSDAGLLENRADRRVDGQRSNSPGASDADADIRQELELAAQIIRDQAPIRSGPTIITGASVQGFELVTTMTVDAPIDESMVAFMRQELSNRLCTNDGLLRLIRLGATITYVVTDSNRQVHRAETRRCPSTN